MYQTEEGGAFRNHDERKQPRNNHITDSGILCELADGIFTQLSATTSASSRPRWSALEASYVSCPGLRCVDDRHRYTVASRAWGGTCRTDADMRGNRSAGDGGIWLRRRLFYRRCFDVGIQAQRAVDLGRAALGRWISPWEKRTRKESSIKTKRTIKILTWENETKL